MKDKMKTKHLDSLRAAIEEMFDRMDIAYHQIGDDSELFASIGTAAMQAQGVWHDSQPYIDDYDKFQLMANCLSMAEWLEELHALTWRYADSKTTTVSMHLAMHSSQSRTRAEGYMIGWHQLHQMLKFLADELDLPNEFEKCWPPGSDC